MTDVQGKPWWLSKGVWGPIIAMIGMVATAAGAQFDAGQFVELLLQLITVLGIGLGWWGRVEAKTPIDKTKIAPGVDIIKIKKPEEPGPFGY